MNETKQNIIRVNVGEEFSDLYSEYLALELIRHRCEYNQEHITIMQAIRIADRMNNIRVKIDKLFDSICI